jgi:hypothetical protein
MAETLIKPSEVVNGGIVRPAPTDSRFDAHLISAHIHDAEQRFVVPVLSSAFHITLIEAQSSAASQYNASLGSTAVKFTSTAYEQLWTKHLREFTAAAVLYEAMPFIAIQAGSNGLYLNDNQFGQNAGLNGVKFMQDTLLQKIEIKKKSLQQFLCSCASNLDGFSTTAVDYCSSGCDSGTTDAEKITGWVLY